MTDLKDKVFIFQNQLTFTEKAFKEKYLNYSMHLTNGVAWYLAGCKNYTSVELVKASILLHLIEAFLTINKNSDQSEEHDFFFIQTVEQICFNTGLTANLVRKEINHLVEDGYIEKKRKGNKDGKGSYRINFDKIVEMLEYLGKDYIDLQKNIYKEMLSKQNEIKQSKIEKKKELKEKWSKINNILAENITPEKLEEEGLTEEQASGMLAIYRGILTYRKEIFKWSEASFNSLFGKNSCYQIGIYNNEDMNRLIAACNPDNEKYLPKSQKELPFLIQRISCLYKNLNRKNYPKTFDGEFLKDINVDNVKTNNSFNYVY